MTSTGDLGPSMDPAQSFGYGPGADPAMSKEDPFAPQFSSNIPPSTSSRMYTSRGMTAMGSGTDSKSRPMTSVKGRSTSQSLNRLIR